MLRFNNRQVLEEMNGVLEEVYRVAGHMLEAPSPQPSLGERVGVRAAFQALAVSSAMSTGSGRLITA